MTKAKKSLIYLSCIFLIGLVFFIYTKVSTTEEKTNAPVSISEDEEILKDMGYINEQVSRALKEKGYEYVMLTQVNSKDNIDIKFALSNKEVTISEQKEVRAIFYDTLEKNNFNSKYFNVRVTNDDNPNW